MTTSYRFTLESNGSYWNSINTTDIQHIISYLCLPVLCWCCKINKNRKQKYLWLLILQCNGCPFSPTYCWPHLPHVNKYITLEDLQEAVTVTLNSCPVRWLENSPVAGSIRQVLHLAAPHGRLPGSLQKAGASKARTKTSLKFCGRRKVNSSDTGNAFCSRSDVWRIGRYQLVVIRKDGKLGWYVTTKGVPAVIFRS